MLGRLKDSETHPQERHKQTEELKKPNEGPGVLICSYAVTSAGANLQGDCHNSHHFSQASTEGAMNQANGRARRYGQKALVIIIIIEYLLDCGFGLESIPSLFFFYLLFSRETPLRLI